MKKCSTLFRIIGGVLCVAFFLLTWQLQNFEFQSRILFAFSKNQDGNRNITVTAAYFKTSECIMKWRPRNETVYFKWAEVLGKIQNPFVIFSDSDEFLIKVKKIREGLPTTFKNISRDSLPAFGWKKRIEFLTIENREKFFPADTRWNVNLACADYSLINHAKFDMLEIVAKENYFNTDYIAWLDIGCYRDILNCEKNMTVSVPPDFRDSSFAATEKHYRINVEPTLMYDIVYKHSDWLAGGALLAKRQIWPIFAAQYREFYECMLTNNLTNTDQAVLIGMFTKEGQKMCPGFKIKVPVQPFNWNDGLVNATGLLFDTDCCTTGKKWTDGIFYLCYRLVMSSCAA